jgi:hypothetical protein
MNIKRSKVDKISISGIPNQDTINVYLEDFGPGQGRIVIEQFGDAWSYYWGAMGKRTMLQFFEECDDDYLIQKLTGELSTRSSTDVGKLCAWTKQMVIDRRHDRDLNKLQARLLWDEANQMEYDGLEANQDILYKVFGPDWYECLPQEPNPKYEQVRQVVKTVKHATVKLMAEEGSLLTKAKFNEAIKSLEEHHI